MQTSEKSTPPPNPSTFYAGDSRAKTYPSLAAALASKVRGLGSGRSSRASFAIWDRDTSSWKTSQRSLFGGWIGFSESWPRSGMMQSGIAYRLQPSNPLTAAIGSSWSRGEYPTPTAEIYGTAQNEGKVAHSRPSAGTPSLHTWARGWQTPTVNDSKNTAGPSQLERNSHALNVQAALWAGPMAGGTGDPAEPGEADWVIPWIPCPCCDDHYCQIHGVHAFECPCPPVEEWATSPYGPPVRTTCTHGGECKPTLNPRFVEWLMGFPIGWTGPAESTDSGR